ncbi:MULTISPECIES: phosphoglucosamine mutase [Halocynthiibacter]|uniref:Phosphoglucosamine mutase n=1 Tax=Halocynthiibacter halioticoli TaxID=2986804 RepID=A0AAE3LSS1_9RHOB|nr:MULTISPECIES: phosphoglucosamine mutase [Halocynthiibacter]MCV6823871.1 phosphoglucosamine mutase [Halocynthiibacter halioticoli]MCW4056872.1 phosphoglucosamine mutase [Halocynthiibacter sp. SDUM655004]MDE0590110.1 phosphoglucosamine mutase [Halocynthiibacter sp. C4]
MMGSIFGTDGVRGQANTYPMTAEVALKLGAAAGRYFRKDGQNRHRVVIGKDTRLSGYMLENALTAGLTSTGMDVLLMGPVPTPAVGFLTRSMRADLGIMISASHNPHSDNGIKFFGPDGYKLSDTAQSAIEELLAGEITPAKPANIGRAKRIDDAVGRYVEYAKTTFPARGLLSGLKVVIDCANGAAYRAAPEVLWELGADVVPVGVAPNGFNINENCGSTSTQTASEAVVSHGADLGICLDGDADRVMIIDETGQVADGDQIMALLAARWASEGKLAGNTLVATVMSNLGLERFLEGKGLTLLRTNVGDRYVVEAMRQGGYNLGGEQSGHIVMTDHATTGDGLIAGLQFLAEMAQTGQSASALTQNFAPIPQMLKNVRFKAENDPLMNGNVQKVIEAGHGKLAGTGRLLIRKSGTEPLIRVMGEGEDEGLLQSVIEDIVGAVDQVVKADA